MKTLLLKIALLSMTLLMAVSCRQVDKYVNFSGYAQGGVWNVKINMKGVKVRETEIKQSIDSILREIDRSLSGYNKKSLLSSFNAGNVISPDSIFFDIYSKSAEIYDVTEGGVDVASAPLYDAWGFGFKSGKLPSGDDVTRILKTCGLARMTRDMEAAVSADALLDPKSMLLPGSGDTLPQLNYNAVAQGYSCDLVARYLYSIGVKDMMVDIGEIFCDGVNPFGRQWTIGIDSPVDGNDKPGKNLQARFKVPSGPHGVVTSGNYRKFYVKDGKKYAHIVDPRTGYPVSHSLLSATVLAPDATMADAYATYCMVIGLEAAHQFISSRPDLECCLIYDDEGEFKIWTSEGFILSE